MVTLLLIDVPTCALPSILHVIGPTPFLIYFLLYLFVSLFLLFLLLPCSLHFLLYSIYLLPRLPSSLTPSSHISVLLPSVFTWIYFLPILPPYLGPNCFLSFLLSYCDRLLSLRHFVCSIYLILTCFHFYQLPSFLAYSFTYLDQHESYPDF